MSRRGSGPERDEHGAHRKGRDEARAAGDRSSPPSPGHETRTASSEEDVAVDRGQPRLTRAELGAVTRRGEGVAVGACRIALRDQAWVRRGNAGASGPTCASTQVTRSGPGAGEEIEVAEVVWCGCRGGRRGRPPPTLTARRLEDGEAPTSVVVTLPSMTKTSSGAHDALRTVGRSTVLTTRACAGAGRRRGRAAAAARRGAPRGRRTSGRGRPGRRRGPRSCPAGRSRGPRRPARRRPALSCAARAAAALRPRALRTGAPTRCAPGGGGRARPRRRGGGLRSGRGAHEAIRARTARGEGRRPAAARS